MGERIDVLGLGAVAVDDVLFLESFPRPDTKMAIQRQERRAGGNAGTALAAARRMGRACAYAGTLGADDLSRFIMQGFAAQGVSLAHLVQEDGAHPFHSTILIDTATQTRTILFDAAGVRGAHPSLPPAEVISNAGALLVDHVGLPGMVRAARIAREAGVPVIADLERDAGPLFSELLSLADHLILPWEFAVTATGHAEGSSVVRALWAPGRVAVVVTRSADGCWYMTAEEDGVVFHQPAFAVKEADTNGCGDVFHGVYAALLSEGMPAAARIRFSAAVAAMKATAGGQAGIPLRGDAERFLSQREGEAPQSAV